MPRKVKVVDIVPDNNETVIDNTVHELEPIPEENQQTDTKEQVEDNETQSDPVKEDIEKPTETDTKTKDTGEEQDIEDLPKTKVRTNELHECPKCGKFMTLKTLKYTHEKTCGVYQPPPKPPKPEPKPKGRPKKQIVVENIEEQPVEKKKEEIRGAQGTPIMTGTSARPVPVLAPEPVKSFEDMRRERLRERVQQRTQKIQNLFLQAF